MRGFVPVWNPVTARAEHPVEHPAGRLRLSAAMILSMSPSMTGSEIPERFCEPFKAAACEEIAAQRVTRRVRKAEPLNCEVEVEIVDALTILHGVGDAQLCIDAQRSEVLHEWHVMRLERRLVEQERHPLGPKYTQRL